MTIVHHSELIPIREHDGRTAVSGRDLHAFLGLGRDYTTWFKKMTEYGFTEGQDYIPISGEVAREGRGTVERKDHAMTLDMAKEVAMIQRTPRGKEARQYFIECERRARQQADSVQLPQNYAAALRELADTAEREERERERRLELEGPAAERDFYRSTEGLQLIGDVANRFKAFAQDRYPGVKVLSGYVWEHAARLDIIIRGNTVRHNQPKAQAVIAGWAKPSESTHETNTRGIIRTVTTRLTPRGEARLWDGMVRYIEDHGTLKIEDMKGIAA